jgi:hypothetical protein
VNLRGRSSRYSPNEGRIIAIKKRSRHHDEQIHLTEEERYYAGYATGYRKGKLQFVKKCLLNLLKKTELPSTLCLQLRSEINLETDDEILFKLLINLTRPETIETIKGMTDIHSVWSMALRSEAEVLAEEYSAYEVSDDD